MTTPSAGPHEPRLAGLGLEALARLWRGRAARAMAGAGEDGAAMADTNDAILRGDPLRVLALIRAVLALETDPDVLGYLAATLLENMLPLEEGPLLDAVEAAIGEDRRFADLFFDIHFNGLEGPVEDRLVAAVRAALARAPADEAGP